MATASAIASWPTFRYERLFPLARHGPQAAKACAVVAGTVEYLLDPVRRDVASRRIARAFALPARRGRAVFRASLISEAFEEAEMILHMRRHETFARLFSSPADEPDPRDRTVYVTFHLGRPVLAYLHLAWWRKLPVTTIGRALSADNPMPEAKRRYGIERVRWIEGLARPFLHGDAASVARARDLLLDGQSVFAPIDLPGDVVARSADVDVFGERIRFASGMVTLARLARATLQPLVAIRGRRGLDVHWGRRVEPGDDAEATARVFGELLAFVRRFPEEWWMWPYLPAAGDR